MNLHMSGENLYRGSVRIYLYEKHLHVRGENYEHESGERNPPWETPPRAWRKLVPSV